MRASMRAVRACLTLLYAYSEPASPPKGKASRSLSWYCSKTFKADSTEGLGAVETTSAPISGCRSQMECNTIRSDWASRVSRRRGNTSGLPVTSVPRDRFTGRDANLEEKPGVLRGEKDMPSYPPPFGSDRPDSSSSSALRFRQLIVGVYAISVCQCPSQSREREWVAEETYFVLRGSDVRRAGEGRATVVVTATRSSSLRE